MRPADASDYVALRRLVDNPWKVLRFRKGQLPDNVLPVRLKGAGTLLLRGGTAEQCVRCGCDLRRRPARSYAEMEGLLGQPIGLEEPANQIAPPEGMFRRWLTFFFLSMAFLVMCAWLASEAFAV